MGSFCKILDPPNKLSIGRIPLQQHFPVAGGRQQASIGAEIDSHDRDRDPVGLGRHWLHQFGHNRDER